METIMPKEPGKLDAIGNLFLLFTIGCLILCTVCAALANNDTSWGIYSTEKFMTVTVNGFVENPFFPFAMFFAFGSAVIGLIKLFGSIIMC